MDRSHADRRWRGARLSGVDPAYADRYRELFNRHWWWRARETVILRTLRRLRTARGARLLDVGCGGGVFFPRLTEFGTVEGVEPDPRLLSNDPAINERIHVGLFDASFRPAHRFDVVLMLDVLEHLDDPEAALRRGLGLLADRGVVLITVPAFPVLWTSHDTLNEHRRRYTKRTMRALAAACGMRLDHMEYFFHWTVPVKLGQRVFEAIHRGAPRSPVVPHAAINTSLRLLSKAEYLTLRNLRLPFGSSLLAYGGPQ